MRGLNHIVGLIALAGAAPAFASAAPLGNWIAEATPGTAAALGDWRYLTVTSDALLFGRPEARRERAPVEEYRDDGRNVTARTTTGARYAFRRDGRDRLCQIIVSRGRVPAELCFRRMSTTG